MKNLVIKILAVLAIAAPLGIFADTTFGPCHYDHETVSNISCYGPAELNGTTVTGELSVKGPLTLKNSTVNAVSVFGVMNSYNSTVKGDVSVYGPIWAENTVFNDSVFSAASKMQLQSSKINGGLTLKSDEGQALVVLKQSLINGGVTFSEHAGVIQVDAGSHVNGAVTNGVKKTSS